MSITESEKTELQEMIEDSLADNLTRKASIVALLDASQAELQVISNYVDSLEVSGDPVVDGDRIWFCGFETGDFSALNLVGGVVKQNPTYAKVEVTQAQAHSGTYSVALLIHTPVRKSTAGYAFYWEDNIPDEAIFKVWFYIPSNVQPGDWWNIEQWKSIPAGGTSSNSVPMYALGVNSAGKFYLTWRPDLATKKSYQSAVSAPRDQWFLVETFYKKATDSTGKIEMSVNGTLLWSVAGNPTSLSDEKIFWSVNNYSDNISPDPCTIYADDMEILRRSS